MNIPVYTLKLVTTSVFAIAVRIVYIFFDNKSYTHTHTTAIPISND